MENVTFKENRFETPLFGSIRTLVETIDVKARNGDIHAQIGSLHRSLWSVQEPVVTSMIMDRIIWLKKQILCAGDERKEWFVAKDVCRVLGFRGHCGAVETHVREEDTAKGEVSDTNGHHPKMLMVNERGLEALILGSKLEANSLFKRYITSVVLPSIRGEKPGHGAELWSGGCMCPVCMACYPGDLGADDELSD